MNNYYSDISKLIEVKKNEGCVSVRNRREIQQLKTEVIALRKKDHENKALLNQKMVDLYMAMGFTPDQSAKMV